MTTSKVASQTTVCVKCLKGPAAIWWGHVIRNGKQVTAGWCLRCLVRRGYGFVGHWSKGMNP
jgi:hypothetical protein